MPRESDIIKKWFIKWALFAIIAFVFDPWVFLIYTGYHVIKCIDECDALYNKQQENIKKEKEAAEAIKNRFKDKPFKCLDQEIYELNNPKNLDLEAKKKLYKYAYECVIGKKFNEETQQYELIVGSLDSDAEYRGIKVSGGFNPRYLYPFEEDQWWNEPYMYMYPSNAKDFVKTIDTHFKYVLLEPDQEDEFAFLKDYEEENKNEG